MWIYILSLFLITSQAQVYTEKVPASTTKDVDHHCTCRRMANSLSKDLLVPFKTNAEWTSLYTSPPAGVTAGACSLTGATPVINIPDVSGSGCSVSSSYVQVGGRENTSSYTIYIRKGAGLADCDIVFTKNTTQLGSVSTGSTFTVCQNDFLQVYVECATAGAHNGAVELRNTGDTTTLDTINVSFSSTGACS